MKAWLVVVFLVHARLCFSGWLSSSRNSGISVAIKNEDISARGSRVGRKGLWQWFGRDEDGDTAQVEVQSADETTGPTSSRLDALLFKGGFGNVRGKKKVLILMSDTGGGHRASAEALDLALNQLYPGKIEVEIVDIWTAFAPYPFNTFVTSYRFLAKHPLLWRAFYYYGSFPPTKVVTQLWSRSTCYEVFRRAIESSDPDMVVSVHPLCQHIPIPIVRKMNLGRDKSKRPISFVTVVTDLGGAHVTWFHKGVDACFVPSQAVKKIAMRVGINARKLIMHGLPIRSSFWTRGLSKEQVRRQLQLVEDRRTVLIMGGGDGVGGLIKITGAVVEKLGTLSAPSQVVVVCGRNRRATQQLRSIDWPKNVNVVVRGFCDNVHEYMGAADCLVSKAGPGTIAEAMTRGLPIVISSYLPGQEEGNVPYCTKAGFGVYAGQRPRVIANIVRRLLEDEELCEKMSEAAEANANPDATRFIARDIGQMVLSEEEAFPSFKDSVRMRIRAALTG